MKTLSLIILFLVFPSGCIKVHDKSRTEKAAIEYYASLCSEYTYITDGTGIMLIGDSNTYALPADILPGNYVNCATSGFTSRDAYQKLKQKLPVYKPGIVIIWIGTNDAKDHASGESFRRNMTDMLDYLKDKGVNVYVRNILPTRGIFADINPKTIDFNTVTEKLISSYPYTYLKSRRYFEDSDGYLSADYTDDGLHLNRAGQDILKQHFFEP